MSDPSLYRTCITIIQLTDVELMLSQDNTANTNPSASKRSWESWQATYIWETEREHWSEARVVVKNGKGKILELSKYAVVEH